MHPSFNSQRQRPHIKQILQQVWIPSIILLFSTICQAVSRSVGVSSNRTEDLYILSVGALLDTPVDGCAGQSIQESNIGVQG